MSERLRSQPVNVDPSPVRPAAASRLPVRDGASAGSISVDTILSRIHALPALSPVVGRVLQLADKETISAREIVGVIDTDRGFGTRVVRAANAPCNKLPRPVTTGGGCDAPSRHSGDFGMLCLWRPRAKSSIALSPDTAFPRVTCGRIPWRAAWPRRSPRTSSATATELRRSLAACSTTPVRSS